MDALIGIAIICLAFTVMGIASNGVDKAYRAYDKWITTKLSEKVNRRHRATS